jgi:hypothetical protein
MEQARLLAVLRALEQHRVHYVIVDAVAIR